MKHPIAGAIVATVLTAYVAEAQWEVIDLSNLVQSTTTAINSVTHVGPVALKLRSDLRESVERRPCFRLYVWPWQFMAKMDKKAVGESLHMGKRYRFLAKKAIEAMTAPISDAYNMPPYKGMWLVR